jgi:5-methylcytosine-specific restriction endonuclease McrA
MKRAVGQSREDFTRRVFMARTANVFRHQREVAKKHGLGVDFDLAWLRNEVLCATTITDRRNCRYCGDRITVKTFSLDHRMPVARGGTFSKENVQIVCHKCNGAKGNLTASEYQQLLDVLTSWPKEAKTDVVRRLRAGGRTLRFYFQGIRYVAKKPTIAAETFAGAREFF